MNPNPRVEVIGETRKFSDILVRKSCNETCSSVKGCHAPWSPQKQPTPKNWSRQGGWNREATPICSLRSNLDKLLELEKPCCSSQRTGWGAEFINSFTGLGRRSGRCKHNRSGLMLSRALSSSQTPTNLWNFLFF